MKACVVGLLLLAIYFAVIVSLGLIADIMKD